MLSRRQWAILISLLLGTILVLSGCSSRTGGGQEAAGDQNTSPRSGGTLYLGRVEDTETLDPQRTTAVSSTQVDQMIYDTLVVQDYDMSIKPGLAKEWKISDDGKTYTFKLREGVKFHSGKPLTSSDVKFTLDRWRNLKGSPTSYLIKAISSVETPDDQTVVIKLSEPFGLLLNSLAQPYAAILNEDFVKQHEQDYGSNVSAVDGTGPFKVVEWVRNDRLVLERNPDYTWGPEIFENRGPAYVDRIVWRVVPESATRLSEIEMGELHWTADVPGADVARLRNNPNVRLVEYEDFNTVFLGMRMNKPPLDDIRVRKAIHYAINKQEIVDGAFYGLASVAKMPIPQGMIGYPPNADSLAYVYDPEKASQLLEEAGWKMGPNGIRLKDGKPLRVELWYSPRPFTDLLVPMLQAQLKQVGIDVELKQLEWAAYLEALRAGQHQLMLMTIRYDTPYGILHFYFHSGQRPAPNRFEYVNANVDRWLDEAKSATDANRQAELWARVQEQVMKDAFWVPLVHEKRVLVVNPKLRGLKPHPYMVLYKGLDLWISE